MQQPDRFVPVPTPLLEAFLRMPLNGTQWRLIFWTIRNTYGWNRPAVSFTWYRLAKELAINRAALYRSGQNLLARGVLVSSEGRLAVATNTVANGQRFPLPKNNASVAARQRNRCQEATFFRRAKDSSKNSLKNHKERGMNDGGRHRSTAGVNNDTSFLAGSARPIPGKYDGLSQNR
jgi:phage replication O-like protein O